MGFFNFFGTKSANMETNPTVENDVMVMDEVNFDNVDSSQNKESEGNLITITWGTGMPIDVIFGFIHKDFEEQGYQDALINSDVNYKSQKEAIIRNDLKMLFKRISLRYQFDIRALDVQIKNAQEAFAFSSAALLESRKMTFEEHLAEIQDMERMLDANDPKMTTMIESYRRGFLKGIAAQTVKFIQG